MNQVTTHLFISVILFSGSYIIAGSGTSMGSPHFSTSEIILPSFNHPPRADAGNDQMVKESDKVTLDGTHSTDVDRDKLKYSWQLTSPKKVKIEINDKHAAKADFTAPRLNGNNKLILVLKLTVNDGRFLGSDFEKVLVDPIKNVPKEMSTVTVVDSGEKPAENQLFASDVCGAGTNAYSFLVQGVKWRTFPVTYAIDASNSHVDVTAAKNAIRRAFATYDNLGHPAGTFFQETSNYNAAQIKITWRYLDGPFNRIGYTSFTYRTDTRAMLSATVTFDSGDRYFISGTDRCAAFGSQFDIQNLATHEIGHAINLGHVGDRLQSMYPTSFAGETLKRTLGNGDKLGVDALY